MALPPSAHVTMRIRRLLISANSFLWSVIQDQNEKYCGFGSDKAKLLRVEYNLIHPDFREKMCFMGMT